MTDVEAEQAPPPRHWEADVLLRDGRTAHIRPMQPEDRELLVDFYGRVSDQSKYYRFFSPMPELSDRDLDRFTQVDHRDRVALILLVAGQMIAVGRYDTIRPGYAEVAFLVEDKHQGRGIGQLLLEHLAQAGRERGVEEFVAEVLPDNQAMIHTFRDAGYQVKSAFEDGVMELVFRIDPTDTAIGVMEQREHRAEYASIERFFSPKSVAIIGASRRQDTIGRALVRHMVLGNFAGRIHVVNPSADSVAGMPAWKTVAEIPGDVDVAIVAVPAEAVQDVVLDCAAKGVHGLVVISSGFAETGEEGRMRQRRLVGLVALLRPAPDRPQRARHHQHRPRRLAQRLPVVGDAAARPRRLLLPVRRAGLGDPGEGAEPRPRPDDVRQRRQPRRRLRQRPPAVLGGGRRHRGRAALPRVDRQPAQVLPHRPPRQPPQADRRGALRPQLAGRADGPRRAQDRRARRRRSTRCSGRPGSSRSSRWRRCSTSPSCSPTSRCRAGAGSRSSATPTRSGCSPPTPPTPSAWSSTSRSPLGADATAEDFEDALDGAIDDPEVDAVVAIFIPPLNVAGAREDVANVLAAVGEQSDKPIVSTFLGTEGVPELLRVPDVAGSSAGRGSVPSYPAVEAAVRALAHVVEYAVWLRVPQTTFTDLRRPPTATPRATSSTSS